uniref:Uncharacterized protein n=1 Tax=Setaria viridis TaxID=4556 RepID=A0A4U6VZC3_SETVI|nr:hypothetical protein SEVIR_2G034650v2 [Setaria viridis]
MRWLGQMLRYSWLLFVEASADLCNGYYSSNDHVQ